MKKLPNSKIKSDEHLVFFRTYGWLDEEANSIKVPIHGWIYEPELSFVRKALFAKLLKTKYGLTVTRETQKNFDERVNLFISDNERNKPVTIRLDGKDYTLPKSEANGHIQATLSIPIEDARLPDDKILRFSATTSGKNTRSFPGECRILASQGHSVISDIDDTVKLSHVTSRKRLLENTFFNDFKSVSGMPELYQKWEKTGSIFHFVSSSPWYLYEPLVKFLSKERFPDACLHLKNFRFKDKTFLDLFKKGTETKPKLIEKILNTYPGRDFTLVGDSGEEDPEVYALIAEKYPQQVDQIYIRYINEGEIPLEKYRKIFANVEKDKWKVFKSYRDIMN